MPFYEENDYLWLYIPDVSSVVCPRMIVTCACWM
jgi:hypothetical protein